MTDRGIHHADGLGSLQREPPEPNADEDARRPLGHVGQRGGLAPHHGRHQHHPSGALYEASEKGTLTVTTHAYGFGETTVTFENNTEFAVDKTIDFQHMAEADLTAKGFAEIDPLQDAKMSGETNWTGRKRLWFGIERPRRKASLRRSSASVPVSWV